MSFGANVTVQRTQKPTLPGGYARELVDLCARFDVAPSRLLSGLDLSLATLTDPETRVALPEFTRLVRRAEELTGEPGLAYYLGLHTRASWHGFLGFAAMTAGTVGEALELAERFGRTRVDAISLVTRRDGADVSISLVEHAPLGDLREFFVTALFIGLALIGETLAGRPLEGRLEMTHPEPPYFQKFAAAVPRLAGVRFGQPASRAILPIEALALRIVTADPTATELARGQCERELAAIVDAGLPTRVRTAVAARLDRGAPLPTVAKELRMSTRTLKRKLADRGTTFSAIVDDLRRQRALLLLDDRALSIAEVAAAVGYTELANFTRAFRRWTGTTPAAHRKR